MDDDQSGREGVAERGSESPPGPESSQESSPSAEVSEPTPESLIDPSPEAEPEEEERRKRSLWREVPILVILALTIALLIKSFVVQAFFIPSSSMEDTLLVGDKVLVNKVVYHLRPIARGDIIVFDGAGSWDPVPPPAPSSSDPVVRLYQATLAPLFRSLKGLFGTVPGQTDYIKRVIGIPGDHVACCNARGQVTVNGVALHERSYLFPGAQPSQIRFHMTVPRGRLWVMGDNRLVSDDSRLHRSDPGNGTIPENKVIGRAFMIVWPHGRWRILGIPSTFGQHALAASGLPATTAGQAPYLPLAGGVAAALPLTWLRRRVRSSRRVRRGRR